MLATILSARGGEIQVHQIEAPTVKDCLVAWAGKVRLEGLDDEGRTRLRGDMADFDGTPIPGFGNVWRLTALLDPEGRDEATLIVVETVRA